MSERCAEPIQYVGCYTLDVYCDRKKEYSFEHLWMETFGGETFSYCMRSAKKAGWKINARDRTATCPHCLKEDARP